MKWLVVILAFSMLFVNVHIVKALAKEFEEHEQDAETNDKCTETHENAQYQSMIATAYCLSGTTATGTQTRQGIAAGKSEWFGKTANVYANSNGNIGELIGSYVIEDTGGTPIRNGSVLDIWMPTKEECLNFGRRLVYVEIVD